VACGSCEIFPWTAGAGAKLCKYALVGSEFRNFTGRILPRQRTAGRDEIIIKCSVSVLEFRDPPERAWQMLHVESIVLKTKPIRWFDQKKPKSKTLPVF
jgi:hypothetical protein